ncbi:MAG: glycosyltransferase family 2 protein [Eubacterium sp.]|nr:glycosyltransferase family 2 protein [Eubacterium sp.]
MKQYDENDKVSVIIPIYKNNDTIKMAVMSAAAQTGVFTELILVDNGRTLDKTVLESLIREYNVKIVDIEKNIGPSSGRNEGVKAATGRYVAFLDADDWWEKDKLLKELNLIKRVRGDKGAPKIVFTARQLYTHDGKDTGRMVHCDRIVTYKTLLKSNQINCSSVLLLRDLMLKYPMVRDDLHEDYICWLSILRDGGYAAGLDEPLLCYRMRRDSKSGTKFKSAKMTYGVYKYMGIPLIGRLIYMCSYAFSGFRKYFG